MVHLDVPHWGMVVPFRHKLEPGPLGRWAASLGRGWGRSPNSWRRRQRDVVGPTIRSEGLDLFSVFELVFEVILLMFVFLTWILSLVWQNWNWSFSRLILGHCSRGLVQTPRWRKEKKNPKRGGLGCFGSPVFSRADAHWSNQKGPLHLKNACKKNKKKTCFGTGFLDQKWPDVEPGNLTMGSPLNQGLHDLKQLATAKKLFSRLNSRACLYCSSWYCQLM